MNGQEHRVAAAGTTAEMCALLHVSRTTLWRRKKDSPELLVQLGRNRIVLLTPKEQ